MTILWQSTYANLKLTFEYPYVTDIKPLCKTLFSKTTFISLSGDDFCGFGISGNFVIVLDGDDRRCVGSDHISDGIKIDIQTVLVIQCDALYFATRTDLPIFVLGYICIIFWYSSDKREDFFIRGFFYQMSRLSYLRSNHAISRKRRT